jgi:hypothetical protein
MEFLSTTYRYFPILNSLIVMWIYPPDEKIRDNTDRWQQKCPQTKFGQLTFIHILEQISQTAINVHLRIIAQTGYLLRSHCREYAGLQT